jgi:tetratricopeptide (TPR) repeat protein
VAKSLLGQLTDSDGEPRFVMLQTVQEYALERLEESGEVDAVRQRHATFFLALAEEADPGLVGPEQEFWLARLERGMDNLRAALRWLQDRGDIAGLLRLTGALWRFWSARSQLSEGRQWIDETLARAGARPLDESQQEAYAKVLHGGAMLAQQQTDFAAARRLAEQALPIVRRTGDPRRIAEVVLGLGGTLLSQGDLVTAEPLLEDARALYGGADDPRGLARTLFRLGTLAYLRRQLDEAECLLIESTASLRALGDLRAAAEALAVMGELAVARGDRVAGRARLQEALRLLRSVGDQRGVATVLEAWAALSAAEGQVEQAVRLAGAASAVRDAIGAPITAVDRDRLERVLDSARRSLPGSAWAGLWSAGRSEPLDQILDQLLSAELSSE